MLSFCNATTSCRSATLDGDPALALPLALWGDPMSWERRASIFKGALPGLQVTALYCGSDVSIREGTGSSPGKTWWYRAGCISFKRAGSGR